MYPAPLSYLRCGTVDEALDALSEQRGATRLLAGGASIIPLLKYRQVKVDTLVDVMHIPAMQGWRATPSEIVVGAATRHAHLAGDRALADLLPFVGEVADSIGDQQVRNMGSIGGGVAAVEPTGDWGPALLALGARVKVRRRGGERVIDVADVFATTAGVNLLDPDELIEEVRIPLPSGRCGSAHRKFKLRAVTGLGCVAVSLTLDDAGRVGTCRVGVGGFTPAPVAAGGCARALIGQQVDDDSAAGAAEVLAEELPCHTDNVTSSRHRRSLAEATFREALAAAHRRAAAQVAS